MIPSVNTCFTLMDDYGMLAHIKVHCMVVAKVARVIVKGLRDAGLDVSMAKVTAGALMHDIGKTESLRSGEDHAEMGRQICLNHNLDEIAPIVGEHVRLNSYTSNTDITEKEIVYYSDKRVNHDQIVTLEERLRYILERYGRDEEAFCRLIRDNFKLCEQVEEKLFSNLQFSPQSLPLLVEKEHLDQGGLHGESIA